MGISDSHALNQLYFVNLLLLIAVVALDDAPLLVDDVEDSFHRLIVGDALRVVALDDATELIRSLNLALLDDLIVADGVQHDVRGNHAEAVYLIVGEELVAHLDDTLLAHKP